MIRFYTRIFLWKQGHTRNIHSELIQKIEHYRVESLHDIQVDCFKRIVYETPTCQLFYWFDNYLWKTQGVFAKYVPTSLWFLNCGDLPDTLIFNH